MGNYLTWPAGQTSHRMVYEFNQVAGNPVSNTPTKAVFEDRKIREKCYALIAEEMSELTEAYDNEDRTEMLDALCDLEVVIYGAACHFGLTLMDPVQKAFEGNDEAKGALIKQLLTQLRVSIGVLSQSTVPFEEVDKRLSQQLSYVRQLSSLFGFDHKTAFLRVHLSNMSKFCQTEDEANKTVEEYEKGTRYDSPSYRAQGKLWVVFNKSTGKILKSINYHPVVLKDLATKAETSD